MPSAQTEGRDRFQTWGLEYTGSRGTETDFEEQTLSRSRGATRGPLSAHSSPVTLSLVACLRGRVKRAARNAHGCQNRSAELSHTKRSTRRARTAVVTEEPKLSAARAGRPSPAEHN